jgi:hypothetical protein
MNYRTIFKKRTHLSKKNSQELLIEFVSDEKNLGKAVEGSMDKRKELLNRVSLKQLRA